MTIKDEESMQVEVKDSEFAVQVRSFLEDIVAEVMITKRPFFVHKVSELLSGLQQGESSEVSAVVDSGVTWTEIQSLSRLRTVVGGRFQNLKTRWIEAGFPLREHRGDQKDDYVLNEKGWLELSSWIARQGYEARLTKDKTGCLFEVRPRT